MSNSTRSTRSAQAAAVAASLIAPPLIALAGLSGPAHAASPGHTGNAATHPAAHAHIGGPAAAAQASAAGSLLYIKAYDVWVARVDGSRSRRLTTDGTYSAPYSSPTQARNGLIAAAHGSKILLMKPSGRVVTTLDPKPLTNSVGHPVDGTPTTVAISPDGTLVAYTFASFECPAGASCDTRFATGITRSDRLTDPATYGTNYDDAPSWIGNHRLVEGGGSFSEVKLHELGQAPVHWFRDSDFHDGGTDLSEPDVSPDGRYVVTVRGYGENTQVVWYDVNGDVRTGTPGLPTPKCETSFTSNMSSPTWSATSDRLAWVEPDGIWMTDGPDECLHQPSLRVPGATQPSLSGAAWSNPAPEVLTRPAVRGTAKVGRSLAARTGTWTPAPRTYTYVWLRNGHAIPGANRSSYRLTATDTSKRIAVKVTAHGAGGASSAVSPAVRVHR